MTAEITTNPYDTLTLELERADSLAELLARRLEDLNKRPDAPAEIYALSVVAESVLAQLQLIRDAALALQAKLRLIRDMTLALEARAMKAQPTKGGRQ
jgi:hypothetical protein